MFEQNIKLVHFNVMNPVKLSETLLFGEKIMPCEITYHDKKNYDKIAAQIQDKSCAKKLKEAEDAFLVANNIGELESISGCEVKAAGGNYDDEKLYEMKLTAVARLFFCFKQDKKAWYITQLDPNHSVNKKKHHM